MNPPPDRRALVRPHVVTGGRARPTRNIFDVVTLVVATRGPAADLSPERRRIVELCRGGALAVAEIAAHLALPISVTKVLVSDLVDDGHLTPRAPEPSERSSKLQILQEVLNGLRARL